MFTGRQKYKYSVVTISFLSAIAACSSDAGSDMEDEFKEALQEDTELACYSGSGYSGVMAKTEIDGDVKIFVQSHDDALFGELQESLIENEFIESQPTKLRINLRNTTVYPVTDKGLKYLSFDEGICLGNYVFFEIENFTEPAAANGVIATQVKYKSKFVPFDWFKDAGMPGGLPNPAPDMFSVSNEVDEDGVVTRTVVFQKMNNGWERVDSFF